MQFVNQYFDEYLRTGSADGKVQQGLWKGGAFIQVKADAPKEEVKEAPAEKAKDPEKKKKKKKH